MRALAVLLVAFAGVARADDVGAQLEGVPDFERSLVTGPPVELARVIDPTVAEARMVMFDRAIARTRDPRVREGRDKALLVARLYDLFLHALPK